MIREESGKPALAAFYYLFIGFIVASMLGVDGNAAFYSVLVPFLFAGCLLVVIRTGTRQAVNLRFLFLFIFLVSLLFLGPLEKHNLYIRLFALQFLLLFFLFIEFRVSMTAFSRCLNLSYVLFLSLSVLDWLGALPLVAHDSKNSFFISVGGQTVETLYGIGGSTADIDSYSGLILMWNLFVNKNGRYRLTVIGLSAAAMLLTFRFTPIVALMAASLSYFFVWNRFLAMLALLLPMIGFITVLVILQINPSTQVPFMVGTDWYSLLWNVTHARSSIWLGQIQYYLTEYHLFDFFYGPLDERMTVDFIDGDGRFHKDSYNPHNTYLALVFRSSVMFAIFYGLFVWGVFRRVRRNTFPIILFISIVAYTNASIIGLQNPAFLLVVMFLLMMVPNGRFRDLYLEIPKGKPGLQDRRAHTARGPISC